MDERDLEILRAVQDGIPISSEPFAEISRKLDMREEELIERLDHLKEAKVIRRFGASIDQRRIGITANAVVVWKVPQEKILQVARTLSDCEMISHCYERRTVPGVWEYNLFTVAHGYERRTIEGLIRDLSEKVGVRDYLILFSGRRFKGTSAGRVRRKAMEVGPS